ncbi:cellulose biosynthesis cyclic di-GMP-binding regulatory protein BcsB [Allorhizobium taibaishanense]|uniref:Cyclic di-GMP-binding protein n=1 Tax=Allorhizobium taibaishanense TaxID=887144 RepID=A0A7W6HRP3_9HYPH|nr:cellulose biosynthesis cyclic di-GMP-binding regulatory protein BcsB [Allorhizobium taibaishanense]MBB4009883.1 hypothetical protein [Allorhizobium taibaishanense]
MLKHRLLAARSSVTLTALAAALLLPYIAKATDLSLFPRDAASVQATAGSLVGKPASSQVAAKALIPFNQSGDEQQLVGEDDSRILSFYLGADAARAGGTLRLAYVNAAAVLPDDAVIDVEVNGHSQGSFPIRGPNGMVTENLAIAARDLVAGENTVRVRARQHHRVDCSLKAVYELWTRLDPALSGFITDRLLPANDVASLLAVGRNGEGSTDIRLIAPSREALTLVRDALPTIQTLALLLGRTDIKVSIAEEATGGPGIDLYFGDPRSYPETDSGKQVLAAAPPGFSVRQNGSPDQLTVTMRGNSPAQLESLLLAAVNGSLKPLIDMRKVTEAERHITGDRAGRYPLSKTGYRTAQFAGRLFQTTFKLDMPADFYPGDYGRIDLKLDAATAPGLADDAQLLIRVNQKAVTSHALYSPEGATFKGKMIEMPLRAFHPGSNEIEILAELPIAADAKCDPASRDESRPRFLLLDSTEVVVPEVAHIGRMPDLAAFAGDAYPFTKGNALELYVATGDDATLGAAMTMMARLAQAAKAPIGVTLKLGNPDDADDSNALIFKTHGAQLAMAKPGQSKDVDNLTTGGINTPASTSGEIVNHSDALLNAFKASTALDEDSLSWRSRAVSTFFSTFGGIRRWLTYLSPVPSNVTVERTDVLMEMAQTKAPGGHAVWTTLSAETSQDLETGIRAITSADNWNALNGARGLVRKSDFGLVTVAPADYSFFPLEDTSLSNLRRLAAAWLSDNFKIYVLAVVLCIGAFGWWLGNLVPRKGVRTDV